MNKQLRSRLANILGEKNVLTDADSRQQFGQDWTRFFAPNPSAIVFPASTEQVRDLVLLARQEAIPLVPSGGRTGLSGGAVAQQEELVVSFNRMNRIGDFDETDAIVEVEAGVITADLQAFAETKGLMYPVDFASSGSSQLGGNIATNAGGIRVLRYGLTRDWVAGLKVVTGAGEILDLNKGLVKNATGYDLRHLFIGSEGTLGFITEARVQLTQPPQGGLMAALLAVPGMVDVIAIMRAFRQEVTLTAFEFLSDNALDHVIRHSQRQRPFANPSNYYVLLEFEASHPAADLAQAAFASCVEKGWVTDGLMSQSEAQRLEFWQYRELISAAITPFTPHKNDVSVRPSVVPACLAQIEQLVKSTQFEIVWFGHIGDGNLHLNILKPDGMAIGEFKQQCAGLNSQVLEVVAGLGGSISAEHGVGLLKRDQLHFTRSSEEVNIMRAIKAVLDPDGIMNPGKLLP